jgi:glycosyltransferase involved in cell wall biosynthesis
MRVLVVPKWYPWPDRPAFGTFTRDHALALARRFDVAVLAFTPVRHGLGPRGFSLEDGVEDGLRTLRLHYRRPAVRETAMAFQIAGMLAALRRLHRSGFDPDVVHAHVFQAGFPALFLGRAAGAPVAITEHYTGFERGMVTGSDRWVARQAFTRADLVAPVSEELRARLAAEFPGGRYRVLPNTVDTAIFHPPVERPPAPPVRMLTVGDLTEKKGQAHLLDALARLGADGVDVRLEVIGAGEDRAALERRTAELGLGERVSFAGVKSRAEVAEAMRAAHLFVLPSLYENAPVVLIEAMASGLPAVATRVGGVPEIVDESSGALVAPGDVDALAGALAGMCARHAELDPRALAERAERRYGYDAVAALWEAAYANMRGSSSSATVRATASGR